MLPLLLRPKSRGTVRLASKDPKIGGVIDPQYMTHQDDINVMVEGHKMVHEMFDTDAFKQNGVTPLIIPECQRKHGLNTEGYFKCLVVTSTLTAYHPSGTCKMGPRSDSMAVVDSSLKVHGVSRLRVESQLLPLVNKRRIFCVKCLPSSKSIKI